MTMIYPDESYRIIGTCFEVHNRMGAGFLEAVYQECLGIELASQRIPHVAQPALRLDYRGVQLEQVYRPDFICFDKILIEIKAIDRLIDRHEAQVLNYLNATGLELGMLVNFGSHPKLESKRIALTHRRGSD